MANYKETSVVGSQYTRCSEISIVNPLNLTPSVQFTEEKVTILGDKKIIERSGEITVSFDPDKVIPVLDPITGEQTGTNISYAEVYAILYSAYIQEAEARDGVQV